ncbi:MAG TPA: ECF transporter S component [Candidatus Pullichristensenella stercorigallinarum]|uniref:Riboflavin transporter n=1 Tax=Candidatus Pullichristensenella stercorigallinarum TaxID=2840909 RepID=A0A9D0ZJK4_9FIRM|nr:ECF transporter S component [Candidatus Pullichristensenella stercorigallinarum]
MNFKTKKIAMLGVLAALAYLSVVLINIPVVSVDFLKYEPKDVIITLGGFMFGPVSAALLSVVVSFLEMVTISSTGIIGCVMNILSTWGFACVATLIYKRVHTLKGAIIGLAAGCLTATALMLLWNYLITPLYMGLAREAVVEMLLPIFLPYNLLKCAMNAALTMLIYKPLVTALRRANLLEPSGAQAAGTRNMGIILVSLLVVATCILCVLVLRGAI